MPLRSSTPPSPIGRVTKGMSSTLAGGYKQAVARHAQPGGIADRGAFDRRLAAVEEAVEHLRVQAAARGLLGRQAVVAPDRVGRALREVRQPLVAAPGRDHREAAGARPVDQVADQRRLVAEGQRIDHAGLGGALRQQRAAEGIGLDGDVDHVLAVREGLQAMLDRGDRIAGAFDDDVDRRMPHQRLPVVADMGAAAASPRRRARRPACAAASQPTRARLARAASGDRSAMPTRCTPGVRGICARYIEPNLPAPIRPTRIGLPVGLRVAGAWCRDSCHAALRGLSIGSEDVTSALAGMPSCQGSSTG